MAGRNHIPAHALTRHLHRPHPTLVDEQVALQHREIQTLLLDNQRLAATHVALKQELFAAQQELRHLSSTAATVKAESDAQVREVYDKSLKLEAELRLIDGLNSELAQVRDDVKKLSSDKKELESKLEALESDVVRTRSELLQFPEIKAEIEAMHHEIQRGRAAVEYEKKMHANNLELGQVMEENMVSMAREIEKLHAELANAEKRARAAAAAAAAAASPGPGYAAGYGIPEMGYGANSYTGPYAAHQGTADVGAQYVSGAVPHGHYDMQQHHLHR